MSEQCVLCSIVEGAEPADFVLKDESVLGIMSLHPATDGHVLVVPRRHSRDVWEVPAEDAQLCIAASVQVAHMIRRAMAPDGINLRHASGAAAGQTVFHFHMHVIPRYEGDSLVSPWSIQRPQADRSVLRALAEKIRSAAEPDSGPRDVSRDLGDRTG